MAAHVKRRKKLRKIRRIRKDHLLVLLLLLLFASSVLFFTVVLNSNPFVYPTNHLSQPSPAKYVQEKSKNLPPEIIKPEVIEHGSRTKHVVALTFDADMTVAMLDQYKSGKIKSLYDARIPQTLDTEKARATFFLTGLWTQAYPKEAKYLATDPLFEIGNHSLSHPAFAKNCFKLPFIDDNYDNDEVLSAQKIIQQTTGVTPKYFRFPGGCYDNVDVETVAKLGLKIIHWDVVSGDSYFKSSGEIFQNVMPRVQNGSIIVFHLHDGAFAPATEDALVRLIPALKKEGYQFVTISQLLAAK